MLDKDLRPEHIQSISNADEVAGFFSYLGYNTTERIKQSPSNLGITNETLLKEIKKIELIANQENLLQIYLFELSSVTVANTQALVRIFRNRVGNYLLVLTSDFNRIDFDLIERVLPDDKTEGIGIKQALIRPRILTVDRLKPTRIDQRVLRRFSYTEADPIAQYEKLQAAYIVADWSEEFFNNRALFSDYYLLERLREEPEWKENIKPVFSRFREMYQDAKSLWSGKSEQEFRKGFLNQVFETLSYSFKESKITDNDSKEPDYIFYGDKHTVEPLCFCLTYPWGRSLDGKDYTRDINTPDENPGAVVVSLLDKVKVDWVIVTNGKLWRLYSSKAHSRATNYYEIDLEEVLARLDPEESFRYFYLFFRKEAFVLGSDEEQKKLTFLDRLLKGSEEYAKRLGERLKKRVFEEIFPYFAKGFISHIQDVKGVPSLSQSELDRIFQGTLTFLYRLLFLLYSESRNLLPVKEMRGYHGISLSAIKSEIAHALGDTSFNSKDLLSLKIPFDSRSTDFYDRLQTLFKAIDTGDITLNVPAYNGGLFMTTVNPEDDSQEAVNARLLIENKVPDNFFTIGLDLLTRDEDEKTFKRVFIDYKSLGVRHLGSIYEGLLEFHLRIAPEKMAICEGKKTEEIIPYREALKQKKKILKTGRGKDAEERMLSKGTVYLENTKHERKATGSYYTPDYIVKYIVENTVGPVLKEKLEALTPKFREAQQTHREAVSRAKAFEKKGMKGDDPEKTAFTFKWLVDELFDIKVLDPAMGSGHFLVEAVDFITDKMIDFLNGFPWNPVMATLRETRETILKEMEKQNITIDETRLNDLNLLKRHVLKRCIYGVDLNPMAVELAKVSLWLDCFTLGAPLSFLDHHLKCGNSLIGTTVGEVKTALHEDQMGLFGSRFAGLMLATDLMRHVGELSDVTATQVKESRAEYRKASDTLAPFKRILDIYVSQWFGNNGGSKRKKTESSPALDFLRSKEAETFINAKDLNKALSKLSETDRQISESAIIFAKEKRFFQWELEFPEIFYEKGREKENPGFDAVLGNPPYGAIFDLSEKQWIKSHFMTSSYNLDSFSFFIEQFIRFVPCARFGMIIPNTWCSIDDGLSLRKLILNRRTITSIIDTGNVFGGAEITTILLILQNKVPFENHMIKVYRTNYETSIEERLIDVGLRRWCSSFETKQKELAAHPNAIINFFVMPYESQLISRLKSRSIPLSSISDLSRGARPYGLHEGTPPQAREIIESRAFTGFQKIDKTWQPLLTGTCVSRYEVEWQGAWIKYGPWLAVRGEDRFFLSSRILVQRIVQKTPLRFIASYCEAHFINNTDIFNVIDSRKGYSLFFLLAIINSPVLPWIIAKENVNLLREVYPKINVSNLEAFPICRISFVTPIKERKRLTDEAKSYYQLYLEGNKYDIIFSFVEARLKKEYRPDPELIKRHNADPFNEQYQMREDELCKQLDVAHDILGNLVEQITQINKQKQVEIKRFLSWLEKELKIQNDDKGNIGIDALTGKATIKSYLGDYQKNEDALSFDGLMNILHKNRARVDMSLSDNKIISNLKSEYEKSLTILLPIKEKLKKTDWLIDQIVYKLYELTDEEIKIVEGKG